jgi:hypothetical protein
MIGKTPLVSKRILQEAQNALLLRNAQTPLIGGDNPDIKPTTGYQFE